MDGQTPNFKRKFDILIASDCLEHIENDSLALSNWNSLLKENGKLYVFVPAYKFLWSYHDDVNMHYRRYTRKELINKLAKNNFTIEKSSYWNFSLFIPTFLYRKFSNLFKSRKKDDQGDLNKASFFNGLLLFILNIENKLLSILNFPFGISVFCIVKKNK